VTLVPRDRLGLVILTNRDDTELLHWAVINSILDMALGLPKKPWASAFSFLEGLDSLARPLAVARADLPRRHKGTKPSRELAAYAGAYEDPAYGRAEVALENGSLTLKWSSDKPRLEHYHYDTFTTQDDAVLTGLPVVFTLGADGEVDRMRVTGVADFKKTRRK
jgi:hypothetical protein